jgi:hypothetical protein
LIVAVIVGTVVLAYIDAPIGRYRVPAAVKAHQRASYGRRISSRFTHEAIGRRKRSVRP